MPETKQEVIVFTSGSFDLFHLGHLLILEKSAALGTRLVVGVSSDELIEEYKGMKPIIPFEERVRIVGALKCVDKAVKQTHLTEIAQLVEEKADIVTIGDDWVGKHLEGLEWMKRQPGKKVVYFPYTPGVSTTTIKKTIIQQSHQIIEASLAREEAELLNWQEHKDRR